MVLWGGGKYWILEEEVRKEGKKKGGKKSGRMKGEEGGRGRSRRMEEITKKAGSELCRGWERIC